MKGKTSVTLSSKLLEEIDGANPNRSAFLEEAARYFLDNCARRDRESKDSDIFERHAERLNREAADVLEFQE